MSVVALTVPLELSDAGALIPISPGGGAGNGTVFAVDTAGYNSISVQVSGVWDAKLEFQTSNDGATWVNTQGFAFNSSVNAIDTVVDNDVYLVPVIGRYFRLVMSNYTNGLANITAYLRFQSIAGLGEAMMSQAMDNTTGTPVNVTFQGVQGPGQQPSANSVPVTLSNENIQDKFIASRALGSPLNSGTPIPMDGAGPVATNPGGWIDVSQYRSIYIQYQVVGALTGNVNVEMSNDGVTLLNPPLNTFFDTQVLDAQASGTTGGTMNFGTNKNGTKIANLGWKYVRFRTTSTISGSGTFQLFVMLRMTLSPYIIAQTNFQAVAGSNIISAATMKNAAATQDTFPGLIIAGTDRSVVRSELIGAMGQGGINNNYLYNGPYARNAYTDLAGGMGVAGPQPFLAEDKTYPVNVRLERSTKGQDSVQDLLQQILVELKLNNHYTRETPLALATSNFSSMEDDLSEFVNDKTLYN